MRNYTYLSVFRAWLQRELAAASVKVVSTRTRSDVGVLYKKDLARLGQARIDTCPSAVGAGRAQPRRDGADRNLIQPPPLHPSELTRFGEGC
jgi:hypothetical protein